MNDARESLRPCGAFFDETAARAIHAQTGLPYVSDLTLGDVATKLNEIAREHYWEEAAPQAAYLINTDFTFDSVADSSVTPSRLRNRLVQIEGAARRVVSGKSRRPIHEKLAELLERLGYSPHGKPLKYSGQEVTGHGGAERSAVRLCLVRAVNAAERPPRGYRPPLEIRPWGSRRLAQLIEDLSACIQSPNPQHQAASISAARSIETWAQWCVPRLSLLLANDPARHHGVIALDITLLKLAELYTEAFGEQPSLSRRTERGGASILNP